MSRRSVEEQRYFLLSEDEGKEKEPASSHQGRQLTYNTYCKGQGLWKIISLFSLALNILLVGWTSYEHWPVRATSFHGILHDTATVTRAFVDFTDYSSREGNNTAEIQSLWDNMIVDHGIVAIDRNWADQQRLPPARTLPSDPSKSIYIIDAYHGLHCIKSIRKAFYQLVEGAKEASLDRLPEHYSHCYDVLKQSLTCNAADHLFAVSEQGKFGNGQLRQCRDWGALRDWASQHTACVGDQHLNKGIRHDFCHGSGDNIRLADEGIQD